jgi:Ger(x)C family germination protein
VKRRSMAFLLAAAMALFSTGCLQARSLDRYGYVLGIGFDQGERAPLCITLILQNTRSESENQSGGGFIVATAECRNLYEAIDTLSASLPYQLDFARTVLIVIGKELAQTDTGIRSVMGISFSQLRIRYNTSVFVAMDSARETMEGLKNELDPNLTKMQTSFETYARSSGLIPMTNLSSLAEAYETQTFDVLLPLCGTPGEGTRSGVVYDSAGRAEHGYLGGKLLVTSDLKTELGGAAVMNGTRMTGYLDGQRTMLVQMCQGVFEAGRMQLQGENGEQFVLDLRRDGAPRTAMTLSKTPRAAVTVPLEGEIELPDACSVPAEEIAAWAEQQLKTETERVFVCCRSLNADCFGFGKAAVQRFSSRQAWLDYGWKRRYPTLEATFLYTIRLENLPKKSVLE